MKWFLPSLLVVSFFVFGCGVSKDEFEALAVMNRRLQNEINALSLENSRLKQELELVQFVEENKQRTVARKDGFESIEARSAEIFDVKEAAFLLNTDKLVIGNYYIIRPCHNGTYQTDERVYLWTLDQVSSVMCITDGFYRWLEPRMHIAALVRYTGRKWGFDKVLDIIEIIQL